MDVLLIVFRRPGLTERVFQRIRQAGPRRLFVVADGPRADRPDDVDQVRRTREITEQIDWPCQVIRDYAPANLGCRQRVWTGICNALEQSEELIVLEDDCLPDPTFFSYCTALLERYRDDRRVAVVSGSNFQSGRQRGDGSYYFSKYTHCHGWATWRRAWQGFDTSLAQWPEIRGSGYFRGVCPHAGERAYWTTIFDRCFAGRIDTWDFPWLLHNWMQGALTALPNVNLVANIGYGPEATHTKHIDPRQAPPATSLHEVRHPRYVCRDEAADRYTYRTVFHPPGLRIRPRRWLRTLRCQLQPLMDPWRRSA